MKIGCRGYFAARQNLEVRSLGPTILSGEDFLTQLVLDIREVSVTMAIT